MTAEPFITDPKVLAELRVRYIGLLIEIERRKGTYDPAACDHIEDLMRRFPDPTSGEPHAD